MWLIPRNEPPPFRFSDAKIVFDDGDRVYGEMLVECVGECENVSFRVRHLAWTVGPWALHKDHESMLSAPCVSLEVDRSGSVYFSATLAFRNPDQHQRNDYIHALQTILIGTRTTPWKLRYHRRNVTWLKTSDRPPTTLADNVFLSAMNEQWGKRLLDRWDELDRTGRLAEVFEAE